MSNAAQIWLILGFLGQAVFFMRFLIQWLESEKRQRSVVPNAFWYLSIAGGTLLLCYSIHRRDPVFFLGQSVGLFVYIRNLWFIHGQKNVPS